MSILKIAIRFMILMTILTGFVYPGLVWVISKAAFAEKANGSLIVNDQGIVIGSEFIAQSFKLQKYFWPRPSAVDYNPMSSGGSNLGPTSQDLLTKVKERQAQGLTQELLFASGSGLDPHISVEAALNQLARVAKARYQDASRIESVLNEYIEPRQFGFLGQNRVNVLKLNRALDERFK